MLEQIFWSSLALILVQQITETGWWKRKILTKKFMGFIIIKKEEEA